MVSLSSAVAAAAAILDLSCLFLIVLFPTCSSALTLITFDVDGTLVKGSGQAADNSAHARAFSYAVGTVLGDGSNPVTPVAQALPQHEYHGSTDGLILLRLARATLGIGDASQDENNSQPVSQETLDKLFDTMYDYIAALEDEEVAKGIQVLPGVLDHLQTLSSMQQSTSSGSPSVSCGLVTGNVEGIARRKMRAVGVLATGALSPPSTEQLQQKHRKWAGIDDSIGFLGGFGSDYCSRNIHDPARNYLDRGEQIAIAAKRCRMSNSDGSTQLSRVIHVGDAPADVLAAKAYSEGLLEGDKPDDSLCIGMVAVATGSYNAEQLREAAGTPIPGRWEPVVLEQGMADPDFLKSCGL